MVIWPCYVLEGLGSLIYKKEKVNRTQLTSLFFSRLAPPRRLATWWQTCTPSFWCGAEGSRGPSAPRAAPCCTRWPASSPSPATSPLRSAPRARATGSKPLFTVIAIPPHIGDRTYQGDPRPRRPVIMMTALPHTDRIYQPHAWPRRPLITTTTAGSNLRQWDPWVRRPVNKSFFAILRRVVTAIDETTLDHLDLSY